MAKCIFKKNSCFFYNIKITCLKYFTPLSQTTFPLFPHFKIFTTPIYSQFISLIITLLPNKMAFTRPANENEFN